MDRQKSDRFRKICRAVWPFAAVVLIVFLLQVLYSRRQASFPELVPENGVLDASDVDFSDQIYAVAGRWDYYPEKLYDSEDFARGVEEKPLLAGRDISTDRVPFGTYRLILKGAPGAVYTLCGFSVDYGTKIFTDGTLTAEVGRVASSREQAVPQVGYLTVPVRIGPEGQAEIICQYSNFVHNEGGFLPPLYLSTPQNIEHYKSQNALISVGLSGALLVLSLYFLLCAAIQRQSAYLCVAFCCVLMALRDNHFLGNFLLQPDTSWYFSYRLLIAVSALMPVSFLLLFRSLYPAGKRWVSLVYLGAVGADLVLMVFFPTNKGVLFAVAAYLISLPYLIYLLYGMVVYFLRRKKFSWSDFFCLFGLGVLLVSLFLDAMLARHDAAATRYGLAPGGMLIFILMIAVSIGLKVQAQAAALAASRSRSQILERTNAMNMDFLRIIAHELKTPLTVISGYAQLTNLQLASHHISEETPENLKTIHKEALRLAEMVTQLTKYSRENHSDVEFSRVSVTELLKNARAICAPVCLKNNNRVEISDSGGTVFGNGEMLLQIFINLTINANRHTENGVITISASGGESREYMIFRVADTGSGIGRETLQHIFEKGYSGDGGTGLGLVICAEAVQAHGGKIWVERTGPEGTVFAFSVKKTEG